MKHSANRITVASLINVRLAALGATNIPVSARQLIETDVVAAVAALIQRHVSGPLVGRAVARALAAPTANPEGSKGEPRSPLASSLGRTPSAQPDVAGPTTKNQSTLIGDTANGGNQPPIGENA